MSFFHRLMRIALLIVVSCAIGGCGSHGVIRPAAEQPLAQISEPSIDRDVRAMVTPPVGWIADPLKHTDRHAHRVWLSPSRHTAYGMIHFSLPLPVGHELTLGGFMREMKRSEGESTLVEKRWDQNINGLRFVADGGLYRVRANLFVRGFEGWAVYAGTLRKFPIEQDELELAERAREHTGVGLPEK